MIGGCATYSASKWHPRKIMNPSVRTEATNIYRRYAKRNAAAASERSLANLDQLVARLARHRGSHPRQPGPLLRPSTRYQFQICHHGTSARRGSPFTYLLLGKF